MTRPIIGSSKDESLSQGAVPRRCQGNSGDGIKGRPHQSYWLLMQSSLSQQIWDMSSPSPPPADSVMESQSELLKPVSGAGIDCLSLLEFQGSRGQSLVVGVGCLLPSEVGSGVDGDDGGVGVGKSVARSGSANKALMK